MMTLNQFIDWTINELAGGEIYQVDELNECSCGDIDDCECAYCENDYDIVRLYEVFWEDIEGGLELETLSDDDFNFLQDFFSKHEVLYLVQEEFYEKERFQGAETVREYFADLDEAKAFCDSYFE